MASIMNTNTRPALSILDPNVLPTSSIIPTGKASSGTEESHDVAGISARLSYPTLERRSMLGPWEVHEMEAHKDSAVDSMDVRQATTSVDDRPTKRRRLSSSEEVSGVSVAEDRILPGLGGVHHRTAENDAQSPVNRASVENVVNNSGNISIPTSPESSFEFDSSALNDSQNTIITEPDDSPVGRPSFPRQISQKLTREEAREKAEALRLRLRLANYRVRTNQITVPLKDLQVRTMSSPRLPAPLGTFSSLKSMLSRSTSSNELSSSFRRSVEPSTVMNIPSSPPSFSITTKPSTAKIDYAPPTVPKPGVSARENSIPRSISPTPAGETFNAGVDERQIATAGLLSLMSQQKA